MMRLQRILTLALFALALPVLALTACGDDETTSGQGGATTTTTSTTGGSQNGICLLNNCSADEHCDGCSDGRTQCLVAENRCVACDPNKGAEDCPPGETCSSFGICAPQGLTCNTDAMGTPTVTCVKNADCKACDPAHQVCNTSTGMCVGCTSTNTQHCLASDICLNDACSPKCPQNCNADNDCGQCGAPGAEAHACNNHLCAECSDTFACPAGDECVNGTCIAPCGLPGGQAGVCDSNEDCNGCGLADGSWTCRMPVNGGTHGTCQPAANGCSDLGTNVVVLPPPYDQYTQACSNDMDCIQANAGIQYNVGQAIRDLVGGPTLDLGFTQISISDANVHYAMNKCADITITGPANTEIDCGLCVPCEEDADCAPIPVTPLVFDLFDGDPLAQIAGALLVDLLWGKNDDNSLHFFCQPIAAGYGACIPCANPLQGCGDNAGGNTGTCAHDVCVAGAPLNTSCGSCEAQVCAQDAFCCDTDWDQQCIDEADQLCGGICTGGGNCPDECVAQTIALDASCGSCVAAVCAVDGFCCNNTWDQVCADQAAAEPACACP